MKKLLIFYYYYYYYYCIFMVADWLPWELRLHFHCVSCLAKSSLCPQPFKSVKKSGQINFKKNRFSRVLHQFRSLRESCMSLTYLVWVVAIFYWWQIWQLILLVNHVTKFSARMIENWTVVNRGYFWHTSSHSKNVASARRVQIDLINTDNSAKFCFTSIFVSVCRICEQYKSLDL